LVRVVGGTALGGIGGAIAIQGAYMVGKYAYKKHAKFKRTLKEDDLGSVVS
jgi:cystathionine beta-lyase family protein involved in aluminum resistance